MQGVVELSSSRICLPPEWANDDGSLTVCAYAAGMPDREIPLELPEDLLRQARFAVAVGEAPSVSAYIAGRLNRSRESMDDVFARWDREQGVTAAERAEAEALVRQRMAADDERWTFQVKDPEDR